MKHFALAAALLAAPVAASAATVDLTPVAGKSVTGTTILSPGNNVTFGLDVTDPMNLNISLAATGIYEDLEEVTYQYSMGGTTSPIMSFNVAGTQGDVAAGFGLLNLYATSDVLISFFDGVAEDVGITVTAKGSAPAPVPLPAGVALLGTALAGLAAVKRRRKSA